MGGNKPLPFAAAAPALTHLVPGGNRELLAAVCRLIDGGSGGGADIKSVHIWGDSGSGKSALLRAAYHEARQRQQAAYFVSAREDGGAALPPPLGDGLLVIDDIAALAADAQTTLFDWHNRDADGSAPRQFLLSASDCAPAALALHRDLVSRLCAGLVFRLQPLGDREKQEALEGWAKRHGFTLPQEVAELLLSRLPRNMHTLTAALMELDGFFLDRKKPLTLRRVGSWLGSRPPESPLSPPP